MHPRFAWAGVTRRKSVRDALASCTDAWLQEWCLQCETIPRGISETSTAAWEKHDHLAWMLQSDRGCVLVAVCAQQLDGLGRHLAAVAKVDDQEIAAEVARSALGDLAMQVAARARQATMQPVLWQDAWPERVTRPEWGAVAVQVVLEDIPILVALDRVLADALCPSRAFGGIPLSGRVAALESTSVALTAVLDFGEINARDLAGLRVGEVLVSERKLGQSISLRAGDNPLAAASLGRIEGHLAAVIAAPVSFQEQS